jgi:hypothetical protein
MHLNSSAQLAFLEEVIPLLDFGNASKLSADVVEDGLGCRHWNPRSLHPCWRGAAQIVKDEVFNRLVFLKFAYQLELTWLPLVETAGGNHSCCSEGEKRRAKAER